MDEQNVKRVALVQLEDGVEVVAVEGLAAADPLGEQVADVPAHLLGGGEGVVDELLTVRARLALLQRTAAQQVRVAEALVLAA